VDGLLATLAELRDTLLPGLASGAIRLTNRRPVFDIVEQRLREPRRFMQVLWGPRQAGKTTLARQAAEAVKRPVRFASADDPGTA